MFTKFKNIDSAFRAVRVFMMVVVVACILLCGFSLYKGYQLAAITQNKIYVLANGKILEAVAGDKKDNVAVEVRDHVKTFHTSFFTLDPDEKVIQENVTKALYLADGSARKQYENLRENNYYSNLISANISQRITVDSVEVNLSAYPYYFRCYATQKIIRTTSTLYRALVTEGYARDVSRSDNNPHGFLIERWNTLRNEDLKLETR
ncbi:conjugative transposon TraK protein [Filimonas zeae]|uniref:Conjugative transposon protein TraK n=1 Tax=Filimonas zeae TaxID=1737353 RepID=A0A917MWV4_9BACT|nr:conjugative transposon protein TraK [Filimonas zeae]MDR6339915.1 conjugative transposon TraK protein [Filimonas zeae]GGH70287.1 conjugative transposon protein TraK [Filimonas zeae]